MEVDINENKISELENKKQELENYRKNKLKGKMVRSRAKWIDEGEKPTNYFCGLESKNFTSKIIPKVEKEDGTIINNQFEILNENKSFYEKLYNKNSPVPLILEK